MELIREREQKEEIYYEHEFLWKKDRSAGFVFPCNEKGELEPGLNPAAIENYNNCINGVYDVEDLGIRKHIYRWTEPAAIKCVCGEEVELHNFTNTCDCGRDYNMSGQLLADRSQWGWDTGETADEILSYNYMTKDELLNEDCY